MRHLKKTLENTKDVIKDELKKLMKKGELTPAEMDTVFKAVDTIKDICEMCHEDPEGNEYSAGYYSTNPNRSPVTGRYINSPSYGTYGEGPMHGNVRMSYGNYSGHSLIDRMVACLEPMYDQAQTDWERQKVSEAISIIRQMS